MITFIPENMIEDGSYDTGTISGLIDVTADELATYWKVTPPDGKKLGVIAGRPAWVDLPPLTAEQITEIKTINIAQAKADKMKLISNASNKIETLKDRIEAGQDKASELKIWKSYRISLDDIDVNAAPDIEWPLAPE